MRDKTDSINKNLRFVFRRAPTRLVFSYTQGKVTASQCDIYIMNTFAVARVRWQ
jgi:hypothetical protein